MNQRNFGIMEGRLVKNPVIFTNSDGSKKVSLVIAVRRNFKNKDGKVDSDFIATEGFIPAQTKNNGVYDYIHKGDLVGIEYTLRTSRYTDKNSEEVYAQTVFIQNIDFKESKSVTQQRSSNANEPAETPEIATADDTPFAD